MTRRASGLRRRMIAAGMVDLLADHPPAVVKRHDDTAFTLRRRGNHVALVAGNRTGRCRLPRWHTPERLTLALCRSRLTIISGGARPMNKPNLQALNQKRVDDLVDREPEIAIAVEACCADAECGLLIWAECSEKARKPYLAEFFRVEDMYPGPARDRHCFPRGLSPWVPHLRRRQAGARNGFTDSLVIGGTEALLAGDQ
jgi:hypothetical protein